MNKVFNFSTNYCKDTVFLLFKIINHVKNLLYQNLVVIFIFI